MDYSLRHSGNLHQNHSYAGSLTPQAEPVNSVSSDQVRSLMYPSDVQLETSKSEHVGLSDRLISNVHWLDSMLAYYVTGKHILRSSEAKDDCRIIGCVNDFINKKVQTVPGYFEKSFNVKNAEIFERDAAHSFWIRVFIQKEAVPQQTQEMIEKLSYDQKMLVFVYLKCLDMGEACTKSKYPEYYDRVKPYYHDFVKTVDQKEKAFYASREESLPGYFKDGGRFRPKNASTLTRLSPKIEFHPITSLMLGEVRRNLEPDQQLKIDEHFHKANMESRPKLVDKMISTGGSVEKIDQYSVTHFSKKVQIEFYPHKNKTDVLSYLNSAQGEGALTTTGDIKLYELEGKSVYLVKYHNYKTDQDRYLVANAIPIGKQGEEYRAELDLESALCQVKNILQPAMAS
ncbi:hypothetical protein [Endozoicomonas sp. SCSIO W0465]|uniref:hypothetical protein n=1 Tax=Endozoicomonas sp. SCSIO W0465 TaxID=2918516 RepID=UPI0020758052|nr:hypothetical protein [Endozoicomonas sp. SCSIO W0465]USE35841.1 hypothetical protein MJO57_27890 [Endozoicomonas sp. SCSIO W0465]